MILTLGRMLFGFYKRSDCKRIALLYALLFIWPVELCVKSPEHYYKSYKMRSHVLVYKEFQPVELENSYGASGPIDATDLVDRVPHKRLVRFNINNTKIIFIKENARWMTKTLRKHLLDLNQHIENQWPGRDVYIQVHDTWNPRNFRKKVTPMGTENHQSFTMDHFHWAGRGIDMSLVSEGFISKDFHPGKLAQLALYSAGFDWCIYKYTNLLHCSVKRDSAKSADWYGCFANNSTVYVEQKNEFIKMKNLKIGDRVLTIAKNGEVRFSPVIGFFHQSFIETERFVEIRTVNNSQSIHISPEHLIYRVSRSNFTYRNTFTKTEREKAATELFIHHKEVIFASSVIPGDFIFIVDLHRDLQVQKVDKVIKYVVKQGKIAPLTQEGNLIVNSIFVSCISSFKNENYAFLALYPYFMISKFWHGASNFLCYYTSFLIKLAELFFPFYFYKET